MIAEITGLCDHAARLAHHFTKKSGVVVFVKKVKKSSHPLRKGKKRRKNYDSDHFEGS